MSLPSSCYLLRLSLLVTVLLGPTGGARAQTRGPVEWLQDYLRIDTTNPPGNEGEAVEYLAGILHDRGFPTRRFVTASGRASLLAKLSAPNTTAKPLLLLHHIDVVPAGDGWTDDPFSGAIIDDEIRGRGAIDAKSLGIAHLAAFLELAKAPRELDRDIWFLASADEEHGGGEGVGWILDHYPQELGAVGAVLTEAGVNRVSRGKPVWWGIEIAQKRPLWLRLTTRARGGHGSGYHPGSATHLLVRALERLLSLDLEPHLSAPAFQFYKALTPFYGDGFDQLFDHSTLPEAQAAVEAAAAENRLHGPLPPWLETHLFDTLQITTLGNESTSINVISASATATLDIRLLPDTDDREFLQRIRNAVGNQVEIEILLRAPQVAEPNINNPVYRRLTSFLRSSGPVVPIFIAGTTDSRYFRERGIISYGFSPFFLTGAESRGIHGPNESIPKDRFLEGVEHMIGAVRAVASVTSGSNRASN